MFLGMHSPKYSSRSDYNPVIHSFHPDRFSFMRAKHVNQQIINMSKSAPETQHKMCRDKDLKYVFLAALDSPNSLNSRLKHCPIMLMGFPSLSSMEGVGGIWQVPPPRLPPPQRGWPSYLGAHEWSPQVKRC